MFKKIVLVATTLSIPTGVIGVKYWKTQNPLVNTEGKKDVIFTDGMLTTTGETKETDPIKEFLKTGETEKKPKDILEKLLKTYTGSKILGKKIVDIFLSKLFSKGHDDFDVNTLFSSLKNKKEEWIQELKKEESYKDSVSASGFSEDDFDETSIMDKYLGEFIKLMSDNLKIYIDGTHIPSYTKTQYESDKSKFEYSDGATNAGAATKTPAKKKVSLTSDNIADKFQKEIADLWADIFNDWYDKKRPIVIKKLSWKYSTSFSDEGKYSFAESDKDLIKEPTTPSYEFPHFDEETCKKFKILSGDLDASFDIKEEKLSTYSDNRDVYRVEEIGGIPNNKNLTSQEAIALLYLTSTKIFSGASVEDCPPKAVAAASAVPAKLFDFANFKNKNPLEFFCIKDENKKDLTIEKAAAIKSTDFFLAKDPNNKNPTKKIVMYRDSIGVHLLQRDFAVAPADDDKEIKKQLLVGGLYSESNNFSIEKTLKNHLKENYVSIFLRYFVKKGAGTISADCKDATCPNPATVNASTPCIHQIAEILSKLFDLEQQLDHDFKLKNLILKDYYRPVDYSKIIATDEAKIKKAKLLSHGLSAPFPEKIDLTAAGTTPSGDLKKKSLICALEKIFNKKEDDTSADDGKFKTSEAWDKEFECYKTKLTAFFAAYTEVATVESESNTHHFKITKEEDSVKLDTSWKSIDNGLLFDSILDQSIRDGSIEKLIIQEQLAKPIKLYSFTDQKFKTDSTDADFISDSEKNKYSKHEFTAPKSSRIQKQLVNAIVEENYSKLPLQQALPISFNSWDSSKSTKDDFVKFLQQSHIEQEYLNYKNFVDDLSDQKLSFIKQITAAHWLIDDNFNNYREYIRKSIAQDGFGAYLFVNKFHPNLCQMKDEGLDKDNKGDWEFKNDLEEFNELFKRTEPTNNNCMFLEDRFSTADLVWDSLKPHEKATISGFKGLIHNDNHDKIQNLPHTIWSKAKEFLSDDKNLSFTQGSLKNTESSFKFGQHLAYLISIRTKDVEKQAAFNLFLNSVTSDLILRDIAKLSRDASIQEQAISSFVMSGRIWSMPIPATTHAQPQASGANEYKKFTIGDNRLKESMSANYWRKI